MTLTSGDLLEMFLRFCLLSLLSVGGGMSTAPGMHHYLVDERHWLNSTQFSTSIALAQAAPGPNVLFVAVLGWSTAGAMGAAAAMLGMMIPSSMLMLLATRWIRNNRDALSLRAFTAGMLPLTLGLMLSTGWLLAWPFLEVPDHRLGTLVLVGLTIVLTLKTRISPVWLVLGGALLGVLGLV